MPENLLRSQEWSGTEGFAFSSVNAASQDLLRCAGDAWLEGASSSSDNDDADEDYGARRRATGARASMRSGRRRSGGGRPPAAAQRSRVRPWLSLSTERLLVCASSEAVHSECVWGTQACVAIAVTCCKYPVYKMSS